MLGMMESVGGGRFQMVICKVDPRMLYQLRAACYETFTRCGRTLVH